MKKERVGTESITVFYLSSYDEDFSRPAEYGRNNSASSENAYPSRDYQIATKTYGVAPGLIKRIVFLVMV